MQVRYIHRRDLLATAALSLTLAACAVPGSGSPTQLATDVNLVAAGLTDVLGQVQQIPGVPPATVARLQTYLQTIKGDAAIIATQTATPTTSVIQEYAQGVQALASVALPLVPGGAVWAPIVQAALSLLPEILAAGGVHGVSTAKPVYDAASARLILSDAATHQH